MKVKIVMLVVFMGAVAGKALASLEQGTGVIQVLVTLQ